MLQLSKHTLVLVSALLLIKPAFGEVREAGFSLGEFPVIYYQSSASAFARDEIRVRAIHGIEITPAELTLAGEPAKAVVFGHTLENLGNCSELIAFKVKAAPEGVAVKISTDKDKGITSLLVPEKAKLNFTVAVTPSLSYKKGTEVVVEIIAALPEKDGDGYIGFDGRLHGGKDEITIIDRIKY